jgi:NADPH2:quinone reductase
MEANMRAWRAHELGKAEEVLRLDDVPEPSPGPGEILIEVEAVGLNFPDNLILAGQYQEKLDLPITPGIELSGRVRAVGVGASTPIGQRVIALRPRAGALAEQVVMPEDAAFPVPDSVDPVDAAALFVTYLTGQVGLHHRANLRSGEVLLAHAGAGGVGSAAIQLGKAAGARVIATAGGPEKVEVCRQLGADRAIDYLAEDFVQIVKDETDGRGADVIYDPVGGDVFDKSRRCIAWEGRIVIVGFTGGRIAQAPTNHILLKNYSVVGVYMGEYLKVNPAVLREGHEELLRLYERGAIRPLIGERVPITDVPAALTRLGSRRSVGKLVVQMRS